MTQSIAAAAAQPLLAATIHWPSVGPLLMTSLAIMGSPGPASISLAVVGSAFGVRRSLPYLIGIVAGTTLVLVGVATGITTTLLAVPALRAVLVVGSAGYLLWLAYRVATAPPLAALPASEAPPSLAGGVLLGVANPKAWLALAAVFASARLSDAATTDAVAKFAVLSAMVVLVMAGWLVAGASLAPVLRDPGRPRILNTALAAALVAATALAVLG